MKRLLLFALSNVVCLSLFSQNARVQAIHNSADAAVDTVDVYISSALGSSILLDDFAFRNASPFVDAPAGIPIKLSFAPKSSASIGDTIAGLSFDFTLTDGETYIIVADGIVSGSGYDPAPAFDLKVYGMGQEEAAEIGNTDVLVHHGSTDAPIVDVRERDAGLLVNNAPYGAFAGYLELPTDNYTLDIQDSSGTLTVASYSAPLADLNLDDEAIVVVASGFLDPTMNSNGAAFGLWVALAAGGELVPLPTTDGPTARAQVIHNCADAAADSVDVYLNGTLLLDNFAFRNATPFVDLPATTPIQLVIAPKGSTSIADSLAVFNYNLAMDETYIIVADGIVSGSGYDPAPAFDLKVYGMGQEEAAEMGNTDVLVHHGSTDAPIVDVRERDAGLLVNNAPYGAFAGYLELPTDNYTLDIQDSSGTLTVASYSAPLADLNLDDEAIVVVASGFLDPTMNSNGAAFGLWVALAAGGELVPLPTTDGPTARAQVIHNCADAAADSVDVYLNGTLLLDNFAFRNATPFVDLPATTPIQLVIAPKGSTSIADSLAVFNYNLAMDETYIIVADGIVSGSGYDPAPAFDLKVYGMGQEEAAEMGNTDVLVHHGSTDAPIVDVRERDAGLLVNNAPYGAFAGYLELPTDNYTLDIQDSSGTLTVASYSAPLADLNLDDEAIVVVASGFLDPTMNSNGAAFGLWVALAAGGELVPLPTTDGPTARAQVIHNCADAAADSVDVYLNGTLLLDNFAFRNATPFVDLPATTPIQLVIAPKGSTSIADSLAVFNYNLAMDETYIIVADGIVSGSGYSPAPAFDLKVYGMGQEEAAEMGNTDVLVHHGSTDAPVVDVRERNAGLLVNNAAYGDFAGYLELETANYILDIQDSSGTSTVASYSAPLADLNLDDEAIVVVASGFFDAMDNSNGPAFGLWVSLAAGGELVPLPTTDGPTSIEENETFDFQVYPNPTQNELTLRTEQVDFRNVDIIDVSGRVVLSTTMNTSIKTLNVETLRSGSYTVVISAPTSHSVQHHFVKL